MLASTHSSFQEFGIPLGVIDHLFPSIYIAQDAFTRQHHEVTPQEFTLLSTGRWRTDPVLSISYTGSIAMIDPPTQTITHIYDDTVTSADEMKNLDAFLVQHLMRLASGNILPPI